MDRFSESILSRMLGFGKINKRNEIFIGKYTNECSRCIRNQAR
jgi:hypothetical protein